MQANHGANSIKLMWPAAILLLILGIEIYYILTWNQGNFIFSLDDPYIHFAVVENLIKGNFGINATEMSAPSSSIIWPFLLAPFSLLGSLDGWVVVLNTAAALLTLYVDVRIINMILAENTSPLSLARKSFYYLLCWWLLLAGNLVGLIIVGMEHSIQVLVAHLIVYGVIHTHRSQRCPTLLVICLIAAPLIRYETVAIVGPAWLYLWCNGYRKESVIVALAIIAGISSYTAFLYFNGLGFLPNSIIAKSLVVPADSSAERLVLNLLKNIKNPFGIILMITASPFLFVFRSKFSNLEKWLGFILLLATTLHMIAGDLWWFGRYETYILSANIIGYLYCYRNFINRLATAGNGFLAGLYFVIPFALITMPSFLILFITPVLSYEIYRQPYQFHLFSQVHLKDSVAVNDLGLVAYQNPNYILDLWGLGSAKALECRKLEIGKPRNDCLHNLTQEYNVPVVIITNSWFKSVPEQWIKLGEYNRGGQLVKAFDGLLGVVSFYVTDEKHAAKANAALESFIPTLPDLVTFTPSNE